MSTRETWTAPDLQVTVMSKSNDPRFGETSYRLTNINRPTQTKRIPSVLTKDEVAVVLGAMEGQTALLARLLKCWQHARGGRLIGKCNLQVFKFPMRWR